MMKRRDLLAAMAAMLFPECLIPGKSRMASADQLSFETGILRETSGSLRAVAKSCIAALKGQCRGLDETRLAAFTTDDFSDGSRAKNLRVEIEEDFLCGFTVEVDGWILAETEAYYYIARSIGPRSVSTPVS